MSVERSGQAIEVETLKGQRVTGGARGFNEGRQLFIDGTSRMNREVQVRICERLGVKFPGPTRRGSNFDVQLDQLAFTLVRKVAQNGTLGFKFRALRHSTL